MEFSDEDLMDYADGLAEEEIAARIETALATDPNLATRIEEFQSSFVIASMADEFAQSTAPSFEEMEAAIAERESTAVEQTQRLGFFEYLRTRIVLTLVSISLTFSGGVAATMGFVAWRVQQSLVGFQTVGPVALQLRGASTDKNYSALPNWYGIGPLAFNAEVLQTLNRRVEPSGNFEKRIGYLKDNSTAFFGHQLRINYRVDQQKFVNAQGFGCMFFGRCQKTGRLSVHYKSGKGKFIPVVEHLVVTPGEALFVPKILQLGLPAGYDQLRLKLVFGNLSVERSITFKVKNPR